MPNDYYSRTALTRHTTARAEAVNSETAGIEAGFDALPDKLPLQQDRVTYAADSGTNNAYAVTLPKAPPAYVEGLRVATKIVNTNTSRNCTLDVNGLGVRNIKRPDGDNPPIGWIEAGKIAEFRYDGTNFIIVSPSMNGALAFTSVDQSFETRTALTAARIEDAGSTINTVVTGGYSSAGDGGGSRYKHSLTEPEHPFKDQSADGEWWEGVVDRALSPRQVGAVGDGTTDDNVALANWLSNTDISLALFLPAATFMTEAALVAESRPKALIGAGWGKDADTNALGSILKAGSVAVATLLTVQSETPGSAGSTDIQGVKLADFALFHRGSGSGLKIDNVVRAFLENLFIECNSEGAIGLETANWAFFFSARKLLIERFTDTGILIDGSGTQHAIRESHVTSAVETAVAAVEVRRPDFLIDGGQYNVNRTTDDGIGIWVHNPGVSTMRGGRILNTICERDIAVKISADTSDVHRVLIERPYWSLAAGAVAKGVVFGQGAVRCTLVDPLIATTGNVGVLAEWESGSTECGVICDFRAAQAPLTVAAGAARPWMRIVGRMQPSNLSSVTAADNLMVVAEDVEGLGECRRMHGVWNQGIVDIADGAATSVPMPKYYVDGDKTVGGTVKITVRQSAAGGGVATWRTTGTTTLDLEAIAPGSKFAVIATSGTLGGGTGTAGDLTLRIDGANHLLYIENQLGVFASVRYEFDGLI